MQGRYLVIEIITALVEATQRYASNVIEHRLCDVYRIICCSTELHSDFQKIEQPPGISIGCCDQGITHFVADPNLQPPQAVLPFSQRPVEHLQQVFLCERLQNVDTKP